MINKQNKFWKSERRIKKKRKAFSGHITAARLLHSSAGLCETLLAQTELVRRNTELPDKHWRTAAKNSANSSPTISFPRFRRNKLLNQLMLQEMIPRDGGN